MKNKSINMFIAAMVLLCLIAIMLIVFLHRAHENFDDAVTVKANGVTESVFKVRDLTLTPTDVKEYDVNLYCEATGDYKISLDYREIHDGGIWLTPTKLLYGVDLWHLMPLNKCLPIHIGAK